MEGSRMAMGIPEDFISLAARECGTPYSLSRLESWNDLPNEYYPKKDEKIRFEFSFSQELTDEEVERHWEGLSRMCPYAKYIKLTKTGYVVEMALLEDADRSVGEAEKEAEEVRLIENLEILGVGKNWLLIGVGATGASVGLLGLGYMFTRG